MVFIVPFETTYEEALKNRQEALKKLINVSIQVGYSKKVAAYEDRIEMLEEELEGSSI